MIVKEVFFYPQLEQGNLTYKISKEDITFNIFVQLTIHAN